jgi:hypothetical protein
MMRYFIVVIPAVLLTLVSGWLHRSAASTWSQTRLEEAQAQLNRLPDVVGAWQRVSQPPLGSEALEMLDCQVYTNSTYRHDTTGALVTSTILLATAGPLSVHAPEVCYASDNYKVITPRQRVTVTTDAGEAEFWKVVLQGAEGQSQAVSVYYGWHGTRRNGTNNHWLAPDNERFYFAGEGLLYKLQLACYAQPNLDSQADDDGQAFLTDFLAALAQHLLREG